MVSQVKSLSIKVFDIVNHYDCTVNHYDRTDTYPILNAQSCRLQLEPSLDCKAPETVYMPGHANLPQNHIE